MENTIDDAKDFQGIPKGFREVTNEESPELVTHLWVEGTPRLIEVHWKPAYGLFYTEIGKGVVLPQIEREALGIKRLRKLEEVRQWVTVAQLAAMLPTLERQGGCVKTCLIHGGMYKVVDAYFYGVRLRIILSKQGCSDRVKYSGTQLSHLDAMFLVETLE